MNVFTPEKCRRYAQACRVLIPLVKDASAKVDLENTAKGWERMAEQHAGQPVGLQQPSTYHAVRRALSIDALRRTSRGGG
jgi:hypothetical protein